MATFNARDALEPLTFDFAPYGDAKGEVPEPTEDQVAEFYAGLSAALKGALGDERLEGYDLADPLDVGRLFQSLTGDEHRALYDNSLTLHADVCGGTPSREQIAELPFRLRQAWYGAVQGWLRPEASRPASTD